MSIVFIFCLVDCRLNAKRVVIICLIIISQMVDLVELRFIVI